VKKRFFSVLYMFLITLFFTSVVSAVKLLNEERIETNQRVKLQRIVLQVLGMPGDKEASDLDVVQTFEARVKRIKVKDKNIYVGYEKDGKTIKGYAFPVGGAGFWGPIFGMVAVDPKASKILGIAFYRHSETPGLGARMTEDWFTKQFVGLPLYPVEGDKKIFYLRTAGAKKGPNELDAITGATGTSRGIEAFLNEDLDRFLKELWGLLRKGS
jgi:Na+-transporting NADH:ubiquinone oxidoreductase subunit C